MDARVSATVPTRLADLVEEGRIHGRVFYDETVFAAEMERIYYGSWVYLLHESQVPNPGDFVSAFVGQQPVIAIRGMEDERLRVFYNRCRHRGSLLCLDERGNTPGFECAYHSWYYDSSGRLTGVPFEKGYGEKFDRTDYGLTPVARVDSYRGLVFVSLNPNVGSLVEHLGNARPYIDRFLEQGGGIAVAGGCHKHAYDGNWKTIAENSVDTYHAMFAHRAFFKMLARRSGKAVDHSPIKPGKLFAEDTRIARDLGNGHSCVDDGEKVHMWVFPNLGLMIHQLRVVRPVSPGRSEVSMYMTRLKGLSDADNEARIRDHENFFGPAGQGGPDDMEMFERINGGLAARGDEWQLLARGIGDEAVDEQGVRSCPDQAETALRALYRQWRRLMSEAPAAA